MFSGGLYTHGSRFRLVQGSVRKHRDKWQARYKVKDVKTGRWHEVTKTHPTRREAEAWLRHTTAEFGLEARGARTMTVNELLDEWWDHVAFDWSPNTRFAQTYTVNKLREHLGSITLAKLSTDHSTSNDNHHHVSADHSSDDVRPNRNDCTKKRSPGSGQLPAGERLLSIRAD